MRRIMSRLVFLMALSIAMPMWAADGQQTTSPRHIGILVVAWAPLDKQPQQLREGLHDAGYVEGRDVILDWRPAEGHYDRVAALAAELVRQQVDVIVVDSTPAALAVKRSTSTIPVVMVTVGDPVGSGLVTSLAQPGGNITGLSMMMADLAAKRLQLLKEMLPNVQRVAVLWDPTVPWHRSAVDNLTSAAKLLSLQTKSFGVGRPNEFASAFSAIRRYRADAVYVVESAFFVPQRAKLFKFSFETKVPIIYGQRELAEGGALMSYAANYEDIWRKSASYVDKILKGAKPSDLPIEQPTKFELVVNLKTAKALGLTIPESIMVRADEVIR